MADNINNIEDFIRPIKHYSFFYDEIVIKHSENSQLKNIFQYDPTILFVSTKDEFNYKENSKKLFAFTNNFYDKDEINSIFEITEYEMKCIL
jgi:hypothetical protein